MTAPLTERIAAALTREGKPRGDHMIRAYAAMAVDSLKSGDEDQALLAGVYDTASRCIANEAAMFDGLAALMPEVVSQLAMRIVPPPIVSALQDKLDASVKRLTNVQRWFEVLSTTSRTPAEAQARIEDAQAIADVLTAVRSQAAEIALLRADVKGDQVLVPLTPTDAMLQGACKSHTPGQTMGIDRFGNDPGECPSFERRRRIWADMIAKSALPRDPATGRPVIA